jgi:hypothetical protein
MKWFPTFSVARVAALWAVALSSATAADLIFELNFENGLKPGGNIPGLEISEHGNGGAAELEQGKAWQLDGKAALAVTIPDKEFFSFKPNDCLTLRARVQLDRPRNTGPLLSKGGGGNYRLSISGDQTIGFSYYSRGSWRAFTGTGFPLPIGQWAEVVAQYDGVEGNVTLLVDGVLVGKFATEAPLQTRDEAPLFIGGSVNPETGVVRGLAAAIDDVRIYRGLAFPKAWETEVGGKVYEPGSTKP